MKTIATLPAGMIAAIAEPLPLLKPPGPGGSCPPRLHVEPIILHAVAGRAGCHREAGGRIMSFGWTSSGSYCLRSGSGGR